MTAGAARRPRNPWLLRRPDEESPALLFCLPYPGTGASLYHRWPRRIGPVEVCPVQLPARENRLREPPCATYEQAAAELVAALLPHFDRPFAFFGHCGSVFIGFEAALLLDRRGLPLPEHLFVSSMMPPQEAARAPILRIPADELGRVVEELMRARNVEPTPEFVELSLGPLHADVEAHRRYSRPDPVLLPCPLTTLGWSDDDQIAPAELAGWSRHGRTRHVVLTGTHWSFLDAPDELQEEIAGVFAGAKAAPIAASR